MSYFFPNIFLEACSAASSMILLRFRRGEPAALSEDEIHFVLQGIEGGIVQYTFDLMREEIGIAEEILLRELAVRMDALEVQRLHLPYSSLRAAIRYRFKILLFVRASSYGLFPAHSHSQ